MKNNFLKMKSRRSKIIIIFVAVLFIVGYACRDEIEDSFWESVEAPKAIDNAKAWYETNKPEDITFRSSDGKEKIPMKPEWSHAFATKHGQWEAIETDIMMQGKVEFFNADCMEKYKETNDPKYKQSYTRMVFQINRKTNDTIAFLMTVVPNLAWLEKSKFKPFMDVTYLFRSGNFGGEVLFHNLDGSFSNGWVYEKGKIVYAVSQLDVDPLQISFRSVVCEPVPIYHIYSYCRDWYYIREEGNVYGGTSCYYQEEIFGYEWRCYDDGNGGGGPESSSGGITNSTSTNPPNKPTTPPHNPNDPCDDAANGKANPLAKMGLAPPVTNGHANIAGATRGYTRTEHGVPKFHDGIDLAGAVGTPIYAQFSGTIATNPPPVSSQPNWTNGQLPSTYTGSDKNKAGNRITVNSTVGGKTVSNSYWHLQAGTPFANNPRTGSPWKAGDAINAGEVIGYIGVTGNANPGVPHVHVNTKVNKASADPKDYLDATVSTTTAAITTPCD